MPKPAPWHRRLAWSALGFVTAAVLLLPAQRLWKRAATPAAAADPVATRAETMPADRQPAAPDPATACFLGVVVSANAVDVVARSGGRLRRVPAEIGDTITAGQVVAVLDAEELRNRLAVERASLSSAQTERSRAELEARRADKEYERSQSLRELVSSEEIEAARFERDEAALRVAAAVARIEAAEARLAGLEQDLARTEIRSPLDGRIAARYQDAGSVVTEGTAILRILGSGRLLVRFAVPPDRAAVLALGSDLRVEITVPRMTLETTVDSIAPEIDPASQMVFFETNLPEPVPMTGSMPSGTVARVSAAGTAGSCLDGASGTPFSDR